MFRAVLFDLDGTLLDMDGDAFLEDYIDKLADFLHPWIVKERFTSALWSAAVGALASGHSGQSNRDVLIKSLSDTLSVDPQPLRDHIDQFNETRSALVMPGGHPRNGARRAVEAAHVLGMKIAVATTPIYGLPVVMDRLARADVADMPWDLIASDSFCSTKPYPAYYHEVANFLGVNPDQCLMVGDDAFNDLAARATGMATYYVGPPMGGLAVGPSGTLEDLVTFYQDQSPGGETHKAQRRARG